MDTGYAGSVGGMNVDTLLGKSFFAKHDLLPRDFKLEGLHTFPTPDFTNLNGGTSVVNKSKLTLSKNGGRVNVGWNFGADKTRALFLIGSVQFVTNKAILFLHDGQPTTEEAAGAEGLGFRADVAVGAYSTGKISTANGFNNGAGWTQIALISAAQYQPVAQYAAAMGIYVDTSGGGVIKAFARRGMHDWVEIQSDVSAHLSKIRCASILSEASSAVPFNYGTPFGLYAD